MSDNDTPDAIDEAFILPLQRALRRVDHGVGAADLADLLGPIPARGKRSVLWDAFIMLCACRHDDLNREWGENPRSLAVSGEIIC